CTTSGEPGPARPPRDRVPVTALLLVMRVPGPDPGICPAHPRLPSTSVVAQTRGWPGLRPAMTGEGKHARSVHPRCNRIWVFMRVMAGLDGVDGPRTVSLCQSWAATCPTEGDHP